jgi:hypothetical protein
MRLETQPRAPNLRAPATFSSGDALMLSGDRTDAVEEFLVGQGVKALAGNPSFPLP